MGVDGHHERGGSAGWLCGKSWPTSPVWFGNRTKLCGLVRVVGAVVPVPPPIPEPRRIGCGQDRTLPAWVFYAASFPIWPRGSRLSTVRNSPLCVPTPSSAPVESPGTEGIIGVFIFYFFVVPVCSSRTCTPAQVRAPDCGERLYILLWPAYGGLTVMGHDVTRRLISRRFC